MSESAVLERHGRVGMVIINRPEVHNCINAETAASLNRIFSEAQTDSAIDVVVLTGAGEEAFCTGLDLKELAAEGPALIPKVILPDTGWAGIGRRSFPKPIISAVNGYAIAGGLELVLSTDFAVAAEQARFGFNEATLGPIADAGGCFRLPHWVPLPFAREMLMTGRLISAVEAHRAGLVNHVVPVQQLRETALDIANRIARNSPSALRLMKNLIVSTLNRPEDEAWPINDRHMQQSFSTPDFMEGPRAFVEKRTTRFTR